MNITVDIVTPVYNQVNFTKQYLDCMCKLHNPKQFEITVIDNGSTDSTPVLLEEYSKKMNGESFPKLWVETTGKAIGFAKASNLGYSKRNGDVVIFLNNDIRTLELFWYEPILNTIFSKPLNYRMLVSPTGGYVDEKTGDFKYETKNPKDKFNYLSGWCLAGRRETFEAIRKETPKYPIGPFIELFTTYFEDTYMGFLAKKLNIPMLIVPCPNIVHFGRVTSRTINLSQIYMSAKEKFVIELKNLRRK
jgi:GT2 family glycosyltransferase